MTDEHVKHFGDNWDDSEFPRAYLITMRTYGTWLHGDARSSVDTHGRFNRYGAVRRAGDPGLEKRMTENLKDPIFTFDHEQRSVVDAAMKEVCAFRGYDLLANNARTNHVHSVVSGATKPELIANAFKSYSTRKLREKGLISPTERVWSRGRSRRYLWEPRFVDAAIDYVLYCQGDDSFDDWVVKADES